MSPPARKKNVRKKDVSDLDPVIAARPKLQPRSRLPRKSTQEKLPLPAEMKEDPIVRSDAEEGDEPDTDSSDERETSEEDSSNADSSDEVETSEDESDDEDSDDEPEASEDDASDEGSSYEDEPGEDHDSSDDSMVDAKMSDEDLPGQASKKRKGEELTSGPAKKRAREHQVHLDWMAELEDELPYGRNPMFKKKTFTNNVYFLSAVPYGESVRVQCQKCGGDAGRDKEAMQATMEPFLNVYIARQARCTNGACTDKQYKNMIPSDGSVYVTFTNLKNAHRDRLREMAEVRLYVAEACWNCRTRHRKCDGPPECTECVLNGLECSFLKEVDGGKRTRRACTECQAERFTCSGEQPCRRCGAKGRKCVYENPVEEDESSLNYKSAKVLLSLEDYI